MKPTLYFCQLFFTSVENIFRWKYLFLITFLLCRYAIYSTNGLWTGDFWEHSAVVRELMTRPFQPLHPHLLLDAQHAFFTPYALLVAATGWLLHLDPITALAIWGIINLCLLGYGLKLFISSIDSDRSNSIAFYALILILFFWGSNEWHFSGFYSFEGLNSVLPYPSTFALGLSFLGLYINAKQLNHFCVWKQLFLILICTTVLITHSLTAIFLIVGISCQFLTSIKLNKIKLLMIVSTIAMIFCLALIWPYFSMLRLITSEGNVYHFANIPMYLKVLERVWPTVLMTPIIFVQAIRKNNWSLSLSILCLIVIYIFGYLTNKHSFGRSVAFILLLCNILLAQAIVEMENFLRKKSVIWLIFKTTIVLILLFSIYVSFLNNTSRILTIGNSFYLGRTVSSQIIYKDLLFISSFMKKDDQVLADIETSWIMPTFGVKVVATDHPLAFVPDWYNRKWQVMEFFNPMTSSTKRMEIFENFKPNFLVITKSIDSNWRLILEQFTNGINGFLYFENEKYILLKFN